MHREFPLNNWKSISPDSTNRRAVLVLDADMPHCVSIVRSLAAAGYRVVVAAHEAQPIAARSRFADACLQYPNPLEDTDGFVSWCACQIASGDFALLLPVTERSLVPLSQRRDEIPGSDIITMPGADSLQLVLDKDKTFELAEKLEIRIPASITLTDPQDPAVESSPMGYPVVLKPARSVGAAGASRVQLRVEYAHSDSEYRSRVKDLLRYGPVILQEYFAGDGVGVELIANQGVVEFAFQHLRLHEMPLTGGGSTLRRSTRIDPELEAASRKLMEALDWHGVAMVEFKRSTDGSDYRLMEINGRFWGSLPLAIAAGADFPAMLAELHLDGSVHPRPPAREDIFCRRLQGDLLWFEAALRDPGTNPLVTLPRKGQLLKDAMLVFSPRHRFDIQSFRDPVPGLVELRDSVMYYVGRIGSLIKDRRLLARQARHWSSGQVREKLGRASKVLFVCYGNINRSAVAEISFNSRCERPGVTAESAGFHQVDGRPADPVMVEVAGEAGLDLSASRSTTLTADLVKAADIIFVMELKQLIRMAEEYPDAMNRCYMLGFAEVAPPEPDIADPYGQARADYKSCFDRLLNAVSTLT